MEKDKEKSFQCEICNSHFTHKKSLDRHILSVHEEKKPFKCAICDYSSSLKSNINRHVSSVHEGKNSLNVTFVITAFHKRVT